MGKHVTTRLLTLFMLLLLVGCDHATKGVAKAELETGGAREIVSGIFSLRYVENTDVAFNLLRFIPEYIRFPLLLVLGAVAVVAMCTLLLRARGKVGVPLVALLLVTAGAVGNYVDRVFRGYVVDFVHVEYWPVFNVADIYVTIGYLLFAWLLLVRRQRLAFG